MVSSAFRTIRCGAHPVYGLMEAVHPVYCFSHKKGTMVPIVKEAPGLHDIGDALEGATAVVTRFVCFIRTSMLPAFKRYCRHTRVGYFASQQM